MSSEQDKIRLHTKISYVKSGLRVAGYSFLAMESIAFGAFVLVIAEALGVAEEAIL